MGVMNKFMNFMGLQEEEELIELVRSNIGDDAAIIFRIPKPEPYYAVAGNWFRFMPKSRI